MPVVTVDPTQYERKELTSAPADPNIEGDENGYIMVRPLPYGMKLTLRDKYIKQRMMVQQPKKGQRRDPDEETPVELETASEWASHFEMSYCIGDHNLLDKNQRKIDFTNPLSLKLLSPKVGSEIEKILLDLNAEEGEETLEDFLTRSTTSSGEETSLSAVGSGTKSEEPTGQNDGS